MKFYLESADAAGYSDGVTQGQLFAKLPQTDVLDRADVVLVRTVCGPPFKFNHHLNRLLTAGKPIVLVDYLEYGWNHNFAKGNVLGDHFCTPCTQFDNPEWGTFEAWVREANPVLTFKRELRNQDVSEKLIPIDFLAVGPRPRVQTLEEFAARPYDVTFVWGYSHPVRAKMHGRIVEAMGTKGIDVVTSFESLAKRPPNANHHRPSPLWVSIMQDYWVRKPMSEVYALQEKGRMAICLPGAGVKCFREQEAPTGTISVMLKDDLARSYPWVHGRNALMMQPGEEFESLFALATQTDITWLHAIYVTAQANLDRYRPEAYIRDYFIPNIEKRI